MAKVVDITTEHCLEVSSSMLSTQLYEVAKKMLEVRDDNLEIIKKQFADIQDAVLFMVANGVGFAMAGPHATAQDALRRAVDLTQRSARLSTISKNLELLTEHTIKLTIEQAQEFGL